MKDYAKGSCLCKNIQFRINFPSKWVAHCHCEKCRKTHGAGYVTWVGIEDSKFHITTGEKIVQWYKSSAEAQRGFCQSCGSSLFFKSSEWPNEIHIALGVFDDPMDKSPSNNAFFENHVDWMPIDEQLNIVNP
ncbi:MAG TPA: GFA family protein [Oceanospirillales bacterium]|nr:GFA family protein [Oceanospirillales bacterium]